MGRLEPSYKEELLDFDVTGYGCSCNHPNAKPPCAACTHPGHPSGMSVVECWSDPQGMHELAQTVEHATRFAGSKGFVPVGGHVDELYAMSWLRDGRVLRYLFDVENEVAMFSANNTGGYYTGTYDTIEAAYAVAELANWSKP